MIESAKALLTAARWGRFRIWQKPNPQRTYVIGVDPAERKQKDIGASRINPAAAASDSPDDSAIVVLDDDTAEHMATWHGNIEPHELAGIVAAIAIHYNGAYVVPEINNLAVTEILIKTIRYHNVYRSKVWNQVDSDGLGHEFGWRTTETTRPILISRVHELLGHPNSSHWAVDPVLVDQLRIMQYDKNGKPRARGREKDDLVFALALALQGRFEKQNGSLDRSGPVYDDLDRLDDRSRRHWIKFREERERKEKLRGYSRPDRRWAPRA